VCVWGGERKHVCVYVCVCVRGCVCVCVRVSAVQFRELVRRAWSAYVCIRLHTSAYARIRLHTSAYVCIRLLVHADKSEHRICNYMQVQYCGEVPCEAMPYLQQ
jgi:hypothetical protein